MIKKVVLLFILIYSHLPLIAQDVNTKQSLRSIFRAIESQFNCNFSYKDEDLSNHFLTNLPNSDFENTLNFLRQNTLFDYQLLSDRTVTVQKKKNLIDICITVSAAGKPLPNAVVESSFVSLNTDAQGIVEFQTETKTDSIRIIYTGFETISITATEANVSPCLAVTMIQKIEFLNPISLTNYLAKGITKNSDGSLTVNYKEFDILPGLIEPDVLQTIQALPGIQSVNETVSFINIRGGTNDQNLILWDGIKMYQTGHFFGLISAFNPNLTQEVIVQKNGASAQWGDGVSGLINMKSDNEVNDQIKGGGGINLISADAFIDTPIGDKASLLLATRGSVNGIYRSPTFNSYFEKAFQNTEVTSNSDTQTTSDDAFGFVDASARLLYEPSKQDQLRINFLFAGNQLEFLENALVDGVLQQRKSDLRQDNFSGGIYYKREWTDQWISEFQLYGSNYQLEATNFDVINDQQLLQQNKVLESGFKATASYTFSDKLNSLFGYQFNETGITNFERLNNPFFQKTDKQVLRTNSFYGELEYKPFSEKTRVKAGLRINHIGKFNDVLFEPRISVNQRVLKYFAIELLAELKSQTTTQIIDFQNDFLGVENRRWVLSKPDEIPILKGRQLSLGFTYSRKGWLVSAEPYIKQIEGITSQSQGFQNQFQNLKSSGSYNVVGVDLLINKRFQKINSWLSYSYANNDYDFPEFVPTMFPNNIDVRHSLTAGMSYTYKKFNFSGGINWHSGKPTTRPISSEPIVDNEVNFNQPNSDNIDNYYRIDMSATYEFGLGGRWKGFVGVSVWNLLNTRNTLNNFYRVNSNDQLEEVNERSLDFTPNITFRVRF